MFSLDLNGTRTMILCSNQTIAPHAGDIPVYSGGGLDAYCCGDFPHARTAAMATGVVVNEAQDLIAGFFVGYVAHG